MEQDPGGVQAPARDEEWAAAVVWAAEEAWEVEIARDPAPGVFAFAQIVDTELPIRWEHPVIK